MFEEGRELLAFMRKWTAAALALCLVTGILAAPRAGAAAEERGITVSMEVWGGGASVSGFTIEVYNYRDRASGAVLDEIAAVSGQSYWLEPLPPGEYSVSVFHEADEYYSEEVYVDLRRRSKQIGFEMVPATHPRDLNFYDTSYIKGELIGEFTLNPANETQGTTEYRIYYEDAQGRKIDREGQEVTVTDAVYSFGIGGNLVSPELTLSPPEEAERFRVYAVDTQGNEERTSAFAAIWDFPFTWPSYSFMDKNSQAGVVDGTLTLEIYGGDEANRPHHYVIVERDPDGRITGEPVVVIMADDRSHYTVPWMMIPDGTGDWFLTLLSPGGSYLEDMMIPFYWSDLADELPLPDASQIDAELPQAEQFSFNDWDVDIGAIGGRLTWEVPYDSEGLAGYAIYFMDGDGNPLQSVLQGHYGQKEGYLPGYAEIPLHTSVPARAAKLGIYLKYVFFEDGVPETRFSPAAVSPLWDYPSYMPERALFIDEDPRIGKVDPILAWTPALDEGGFENYGIYSLSPESLPRLEHNIAVGSDWYQFKPDGNTWDWGEWDWREWVWDYQTHALLGPAAASFYEMPSSLMLPASDYFLGDSSFAAPDADGEGVLQSPYSAGMQLVKTGADRTGLYVHWNVPGSSAYLTGSLLYVMDEEGNKLAPLGFVSNQPYVFEGGVMTVPDIGALPEGAAGIGIFTVGEVNPNEVRMSADFAWLPFESLEEPGDFPAGFIDLDANAGEIGGPVWWLPPGNESGIQSYTIFLADEDKSMIGVPIADVAADADSFSVEIPKNTPLGTAQYVVIRPNGGHVGAMYLWIDDTSPSSRHALEWYIRSNLGNQAPLDLRALLQYARYRPDIFDTADAYRILLQLIDPQSIPLYPPYLVD